jgi:hypothetical protein
VNLGHIGQQRAEAAGTGPTVRAYEPSAAVRAPDSTSARPLAQDEFLDLAGAGLRQFVDDDNPPGDLEASESLQRELAQLVRVGLGPGGRRS